MLLWTILAFGVATAAVGAAEDDALDARTQRLSAQLRCLVCQNQSVADSHAALALDLRAQVRELLRAGRSEDEVIAHLSARYGDFVVYKPPFKASTALLWSGPALLLLAAGGVLAGALRRRTRMDPAAFESDEEPAA
jgi:cytochrome c-type biogenesis protein CcmH